MTIGCIIQARTGSNRLPNKVMMKVDDKTILEYVISQIKNTKFIEKLIIATTEKKEDNIIEKEAKRLKISIFRGSELDVLDRYFQCAKEFSLKTIIRITCDNPFIDPTIIDKMIEIFGNNKNDYITNSFPRTFPQGTEVEIFSFKTLEKTWKNAKKKSEREHVTPYIYNNKNKFKIKNITYIKDLSHLRWTVDREKDLDFVKILSKKIEKRPILMENILKKLEEEPELIRINSDYILNEGYLKSLEEDKKHK